MKDWIAVFAVALVIIVGSAAGLSGTLAFLLTFLIAWYLLTARQLGFARARDALGIKFELPIWTADNWRKLTALFGDDDKLIKATAAALVTLSAALMLSQSFAFSIAAIFAVLYAFDIWRGGLAPQLRFARLPDAGTTARQRAALTRSAQASGRQRAIRPLKRQKLRRPPTRAMQRRPGAAAVPSNSKRRNRKPAKPSAWMLQPLPSRKPDTPMITLKPRKLVRPRPPQQRRLLRKPLLRLKPAPVLRRPAGNK